VIPLSLIGVRVEVPTNQPIVLLREEGGARFLPIFIGSPEATAIVYALQGMETPRPMTHDLFKTVLDDLAVTLEKVEITELDLRVERAVVELGDHDLLQPHRHVVEDGLEEVVGHGPRGLHALEGVHDGGRLRRADEDRQVPLSLVLAQQHDRLVRGDLDSNAHQRQTDHALPP